MVWQCRWRGCGKWAQSNGLVLCSAHFRENAILLEHNHSGAEALANLRNNIIAAPAENDPPVDGPPFFPVVNRRQRHQPRPLLVVAREEVGRGGVPVDEGPPLSPRRDRIQPNLPRPLPVAREEVGGVRELVSGDRVGNILAENANNNAQLLDVLADMAAVGENIDYQANNNDTHGVVDATEEVGGVRELVSGDRVGNILAENAKNNAQLLDVADMAAVGENIDYQANNNDTHGVVDATEEVGGVRELVSGDRVSNILAENANNNAQLLDVHESESEQQFAAREEEGVGEEINAEQRAGDPVGDVILDILGANENIGNVENNEEFQDDRRDVVDFPGHEEEHDEYEWSSDIAQINHRLELFIQQQQLKDDKISELERRIKELEHWKITRISTSWASCTSVGGDSFLAAADSVSQEMLAGENEDNTSFNGHGDDKRKKQRTGRRGRNPPLLESTAQPPTKRRRACMTIMSNVSR